MKAQQTSKDYFLLLSILYAALLFGQVFFAGICYYLLNYAGVQRDGAAIETFKYVVPTIALAGLLGSFFLAKTMLSAAQNKTTLSDKLNAYRTTFLVRCALVELPVLFATVIYLVTGSPYFLYIALALIAFFAFTNVPSIARTATELNLDWQEKAKIEDPKALVCEVPLRRKIY